MPAPRPTIELPSLRLRRLIDAPFGRAAWLPFAALAVLVACVVARFGARFVDEDQTLYWLAAREFAHLHFPEPCFFGQSYNALWEAAVAAPLGALHLPLPFVIPTIAALAGALSFVVIAWHVGRPGSTLAALIICLALALPTHFWMLQSLAGYNGGALAAMLALVLASQPGSRRAGWAGFLLTFGVWISPAAMMLAAPVGLVIFGNASWRNRFDLVLGLSVGALAAYLSRKFYEVHPNFIVHKMKELEYSKDNLTKAIDELDRYFGNVTPGNPLGPWLWVAILLTAVVLLLWHKRWLQGAAIAWVLAIAVAGLSINKVHDGSEFVFFDLARAYLALPILGALAIAWVCQAVPLELSPKLTPVLAVVAFVLLGHHLYGFTERAEHEGHPSTHVVKPVEAELLEQQCDALHDVAQADGAGVVVFIPQEWRPQTYGCAARWNGELQSIHPGYERRTWVLENEKATAREGFIVVGADKNFCAKVAGQCPVCREQQLAGPDEPKVTVAHCQPIDTIDLLRRANVAIRGF